MRPVLIAPGAFPGLRASQVAAAIGRGLEHAGFAVDLCPATDGGPGTLETLLVALGGEAMAGGFALIEDGATAIAETPAALDAARDSGASAIVLAMRGAPMGDVDPGDTRLVVLDATCGAPFVLDALDYDDRMRAARAVILGGASIDRTTLRNTLVSEAATRARQAGVPCFAITAHNGIDRFDQRMLDLEVVATATTLPQIERAAQALAPHLPSS